MKWVNAITRDLLEVPHLHLTLTIDDALRLFFHAQGGLMATVVVSSLDPPATQKDMPPLNLSPAERLNLLALSDRETPEITQRRQFFREVERFFGLDVHREYIGGHRREPNRYREIVFWLHPSGPRNGHLELSAKQQGVD